MPAPRRKKMSISIMVPFIIVALFFGIMIWQKYRSSHDAPVAPLQPNSESTRSVTLFFTADGTHLARETRELDICTNGNDCLKSVLDELLNGPVSELEEVIPEGSVVTSLRIDGSQVIIEFNRQFSEAMLSGSSAEMLAVYSVVNSITINFPQIQKVKIDVDGNKAVILRHLDISEPLEPDYTLERLQVPQSEKAASPKAK